MPAAEGCGCGVVEEPAEVAVEDGCAADETVAVDAPVENTVEGVEGEEVVEPEVIRVADKVVTIPRLPFFGCEEVTADELRAVIDEIVRNPEH
jgi:hypothetical protein